MSSKIKLNAAQVIKHMSEKELEPYTISLEKKTKGPGEPPEWFKTFLKDFNKFKDDMYEFKDKQEKFNKLVIKRLDSIDDRIDNLVKKNNLKE